jgi:hypothetical protein
MRDITTIRPVPRFVRASQTAYSRDPDAILANLLLTKHGGSLPVARLRTTSAGCNRVKNAAKGDRVADVTVMLFRIIRINNFYAIGAESFTPPCLVPG